MSVSLRGLLGVVLALCCVPAGALAGEAEDVAVATYQIRQKYCADASLKEEKTQVAMALKEIMPVYVRVSEVYDRTQEDFLLYWRGVLQECIGQEDLAKEDLLAFLASEKAVGDFPDLARDARQRLRRMDRATTRKAATVAAEKTRPPLFVLGVGFGVQELRYLDDADRDEVAYAVVPVDLSLRLVGPLRLMAYARIGIGDRYDVEGKAEVPEIFNGEEVRSILVIFGLGAEFRIQAPVQPRFGVMLQLAPNPEHADFGGGEDYNGGLFLPGIAGFAGLDIPLGTPHLMLRPQLEIGVLGQTFSGRFLGALALAFP